MEDLYKIMVGNYSEENLLELYKLKLISLEKNEQNQDLINYYKNEIIKIKDNIELRKKYTGK